MSTNKPASQQPNQVAQRPKFSAMITTEAFQRSIKNSISDPVRAQRFTASITSAVATSPSLQLCEPSTILSCALLGEALGLSPSPQLGQFYMIKYDMGAKYDKGELVSPAMSVAQFQLGYKGYIQLALRSGYYKKLNVLAIKEGELIKFDPLNEEIEVQLIPDEDIREDTKTIGYYAMFEYMNGFRKVLYWTTKKMEAHAIKYSKGYKAKKGYTFWEKDFDAMAYKTMLRQLISKWGIMSIEMQQAIEADIVADQVADAGFPESEIIQTTDFNEAQEVSMNDL